VRQIPEVSDVPAASEPVQVSLRAVEQALEEAAGELAERILPAQDVSRTAEWLAERTSLSSPEHRWLDTLFIAAFTVVEIISAGVMAALIGYTLEMFGAPVSPSGMFRGTLLLASGFVGY